jgi:tRNA-specific 2-thiouridylase
MPGGGRTVVAMSGGVDSTVAALLLRDAGHEVVGVHMRLHDGAGGAGRCCGMEDALDARRSAALLGVPFYTVDLRDAFRAAVMEELADSRRRGLTPNPCVRCNGTLKFDVLLRKLDALGAGRLATGHYARTSGGRLFTAVDAGKDQSYFLHPVRRSALERALFPLGALTKAEVRALARSAGLAVADKAESMEVCFLPDDDYAGFVARRYPDLEGAGAIVDEEGTVLGTHAAYWAFTVGQRRGLGLAGGPWFVLRVDPDTRQVVVGRQAALRSWSVTVGGTNWLRRPDVGEPILARLRHRGALVPCELSGDAEVEVRFTAPARAAAPGQSLVIYAAGEVLGGGTIVGAR